MFRPEDRPNLEYNWKALKRWVKECQSDASILSKFCLQAVNNRVHGLKIDFASKVIISDYRGRNRTLWSEEEQQRFRDEGRHLKQQQELPDIDQLDEHAYEQENNFLELDQNCNMDAQLEDNGIQLQALNDICRAFDRCQNQDPSQHTESIINSSMLVAGLGQQQAQHIGQAILDAKQIVVEPPNTNTASSSPADRDILLNRLCMNHRRNQKLCHNLYAQYFANANSSKPPSVVMLQGQAGTGKSYVIKSITEAAKVSGKRTVQTAFNAINAQAVNGPTFASLVHLEGRHKKVIEEFKNPQHLHEFINDHGIKDTDAIIIDEASNMAAWHLARLNEV